MSESRILAVSGRAVVLRGPDIDTDRIIPARFLKAVTFDGLEQHVFADDRQALSAAGQRHPFDHPESAGASILVVNKNFGCGSSREHAPQALYRWGIRAVVGESFADIFFSNALMLGLPCVSLSAPHIEALMTAVNGTPSLRVAVDVEHGAVSVTGSVWPVFVPAHAKDALTSGHWDGAGLLLARYEEVDAVASRLPY